MIKCKRGFIAINPLHVVYLAVLIGVAVGGWYVVRSYNEAITAARVLEGENASLRAAADDLQTMLNDADEQAKQNKQLAAARQVVIQQQQLQLKELLNRDPEAKSWYDTPIPDSVKRLRHSREGSGAPSVPSANGKPLTDPGPAAKRGDQR